MKKNPSAFTNFMLSKASRMALPLSGTFELTPMCNFDCKMCYVRKDRQQVLAHNRPMLTLQQWLDIAEEAKEHGLLYLLLTGGEPLSWPYFWELYEALCRMGILVSINTNGSLIDEEAIARFQKNPPRRINLTLYGAHDETYEALCRRRYMFDQIAHTIDRLKEAELIVKLNCSLTPDNVKDLEEMITYAQERGLILDVVTYMFPPVRKDQANVGENPYRFTPEETARYRMRAYQLMNSEERYAEYLQNILDGMIDPPGLDDSCEDPIDGRIRCRAGKASFWITWDGYNTPCGMMTEPKSDVVKHGFYQSWLQINKISQELRLSGTCTNCTNQDLCHACAAMAYTETGTYTGIPKFLCETALAMKRQAQKEIKKINN